MALQAGMGLSRIVLIIGAGYTGTILMKNGKLSDVLGELQSLVKGMEKSGEADGDTDYYHAMASEIHRLATEIRQLDPFRQVIIPGGSCHSNLSALVMPAATLGALGYGYMWWKGLSLSDLMYVTKKSMANAVNNLTKHLESVSEALAATKRHLTQRIENLDGKLDDQVEISKLIRNEVNDVRGDLSQIVFDLDGLQRLVSGLDGKLLSLEKKQDLTNAGVMYLCSKIPEMPQDQFKVSGNPVPSLMGLKEIAESLSFGNNFLTDGNIEDSNRGPDKFSKPLRRIESGKC